MILTQTYIYHQNYEYFTAIQYHFILDEILFCLSTGTILSLGESFHILTKKRRKKLNGRLMYLPSMLHSPPCTHSHTYTPYTLTHSREERKWIEKQNKVMRQKRKKEEVARIRTLVGT